MGMLTKTVDEQVISMILPKDQDLVGLISERIAIQKKGKFDNYALV